MDSYSSFAEYYDALMEDARYPERCQYLFDAAEKFGHTLGKTLDLACGTGSLTLLLAERGVDVFGADGSVDMLSEAMRKSLDAGQHILFVCQEMQALELPQPLDTCVCTLDSLNHLVDKNDVQAAFNGVSRYMNPGGLFLFDMNTVYKHREVLADNVFVLENERVFCVWQNFTEDNLTEISLDFFEEQNGAYYRSSEDFSERAYADGEIREMLQSAGFETLGCYGDLTFEPPQADEQRVIYIARKLK